jgi:hypothetical protein
MAKGEGKKPTTAGFDPYPFLQDHITTYNSQGNFVFNVYFHFYSFFSSLTDYQVLVESPKKESCMLSYVKMRFNGLFIVQSTLRKFTHMKRSDPWWLIM